MLAETNLLKTYSFKYRDHKKYYKAHTNKYIMLKFFLKYLILNNHFIYLKISYLGKKKYTTSLHNIIKINLKP